MSGLARKIGLFTPNARRMYSFLEKKILNKGFELCIIDFDEKLFHLSSQALSDLQYKLDFMDILIADVRLITPYLSLLKNVKWIQLTWAGVEGVFSRDLMDNPPTFPITRFGGVFGEHMAEYTISNIINYERNAFNHHDKQKTKKWNKPLYHLLEYRMVSDLKITILGCGSIGVSIAKHCKQFGATVYGMVNTDGKEKDEFVDEYFTSPQLPSYLQKSDYVCSVLPSTPSTRYLLTSDLLQHCKNVVFINIGRGDVIKEEVILHALEKGWFKGAILDVFETEPLPEKSRLWECPNVHITPHVSGVTQPRDVADVFMDQLERFESNQPLKFTIDWRKGY